MAALHILCLYVYIKEIIWAQYIKSKLGITHFAHGNLTCSLQPN